MSAELADAVVRIGQLSPDQYASAADVFHAFRTGVKKVLSSGQQGVEDILDDLEPKAKVFAFLIALHQQKKIYRKQVAAVFQELVQVDSWTQALRGDEALYRSLPGDLKAPQRAGAEPKAPACAASAAPLRQNPRAGSAETGQLKAVGAKLEVAKLEVPASAEPAAPLAQRPLVGAADAGRRRPAGAEPEAPASAAPAASPAQHSQPGPAAARPASRLEDAASAAPAPEKWPGLAGEAAEVPSPPPAAEEASASAFEPPARAEAAGDMVPLLAGSCHLWGSVQQGRGDEACGSPREGLAGRQEACDASARGTPDGEAQPSSADVQEAIDKAMAKVEAANAPPAPTSSFTLRATSANELLEESVAKIQALKWSSASGELLHIDESGDAYMSFGRAVGKSLACGASREERDALSELEPKEAVLRFLAAFSRQSKKYRPRVSTTTARLQECESWVSCISANAGLQAAVRDILQARIHRGAQDIPSGMPSCGSIAGSSVDGSIAGNSTARGSAPGSGFQRRSHTGENDLACTKGHSISKRKVGLRFFEKVFNWSTRRCQYCNREILQDAVAWRCSGHCGFDICEACYQDGQCRADSRPLGVSRVQIPMERIRNENGVVLFEVEVVIGPSGRVHQVRRRYTEFLELSRSLGSETLTLRGYPFPQKTMFGLKCSEPELQKRREALAGWLQATIEHRLSASTWRDPLSRFLDLDPEHGMCAAARPSGR